MELLIGQLVSLRDKSQFARQAKEWGNKFGTITEIEENQIENQYTEVWYKVETSSYENYYKLEDLNVEGFTSNKAAKILLSQEEA